MWVQRSTADITGRRRWRFCCNQRQSEWQASIMRLPPGNIKVSRTSTLSTRGRSERHEKKKSMPAWSPFRNKLPPSDLLSVLLICSSCHTGDSFRESTESWAAKLHERHSQNSVFSHRYPQLTPGQQHRMLLRLIAFVSLWPLATMLVSGKKKNNND